MDGGVETASEHELRNPLGVVGLGTKPCQMVKGDAVVLEHLEGSPKLTELYFPETALDCAFHSTFLLLLNFHSLSLWETLERCNQPYPTVCGLISNETSTLETKCLASKMLVSLIFNEHHNDSK